MFVLLYVLTFSSYLSLSLSLSFSLSLPPFPPFPPPPPSSSDSTSTFPCRALTKGTNKKIKIIYFFAWLFWEKNKCTIFRKKTPFLALSLGICVSRIRIAFIRHNRCVNALFCFLLSYFMGNRLSPSYLRMDPLPLELELLPLSPPPLLSTASPDPDPDPDAPEVAIVWICPETTIASASAKRRRRRSDTLSILPPRRRRKRGEGRL